MSTPLSIEDAIAELEPSVEAEEDAEDQAEPEDAEVEDEGEGGERDESEGDPDETLPKYRFKADGEWYDVDESQLIAFAQKGVNYTRKMQEHAETSAQVEALQAQLLEREQAAAKILDDYAERLQGSKEYSEPNWEQIKRDNPEQFPYLWAAHQHKMAELVKAAEQRKALQDSIDARLEVERARVYNTELQRLTAMVPEWKDPDVRKRAFAELRAYAVEELGIDSAFVDSIPYASVVDVFRKAREFDRMQKDKPRIKDKIEQAKRAAPNAVVQPMPRSRVQKIEARQRQLQRSGRIDDAVALLDEFNEG